LAICLSGCSTFKAPLREDFNEYLIALHKSETRGGPLTVLCLKRRYRISPDYVGPLGEPEFIDCYDIEEDGEEVNAIIGLSPQQKIKQVLWHEELYQAIQDFNNARKQKGKFSIDLKKTYLETEDQARSFINRGLGNE
jgi:hypothetical protein